MTRFMTRGPKTTIVAGRPPVSNVLVSLSLDGTSNVLLPQTLSADGSRYANKDGSLVFWIRGNRALVLQKDQESTYQNCIVVKEDPGTLPQAYLDSKNNFTIRYPNGYTVDDSYSYKLLGPDRDIAGIKFAIPDNLAKNTHLSDDSYLSVEHLTIPNCSPKYFLAEEQTLNITPVKDDDFLYLFSSTADSGVGNRYKEYVYTISGSNPCLAIRYLIHYSAFENYPTGRLLNLINWRFWRNLVTSKTL